MHMAIIVDKLATLLVLAGGKCIALNVVDDFAVVVSILFGGKRCVIIGKIHFVFGVTVRFGLNFTVDIDVNFVTVDVINLGLVGVVSFVSITFGVVNVTFINFMVLFLGTVFVIRVVVFVVVFVLVILVSSVCVDSVELIVDFVRIVTDAVAFKTGAIVTVGRCIIGVVRCVNVVFKVDIEIVVFCRDLVSFEVKAFVVVEFNTKVDGEGDGVVDLVVLIGTELVLDTFSNGRIVVAFFCIIIDTVFNAFEFFSVDISSNGMVTMSGSVGSSEKCYTMILFN